MDKFNLQRILFTVFYAIEHYSTSMLRFFNKYNYEIFSRDKLPIDRFGADPLCMDQYKRLIATCRIPAKTIDRLHLYNKNSHHHVAVFYRNNVRKL
jgi:hypothetical protein